MNTEYLKKQNQLSKALALRFEKSYNQSISKLQPVEQAEEPIDVNIYAPQIQDVDTNLRQLLSQYLKPNVIEKLLVDLPQEVKSIGAEYFYSNVAPMLQSFQGRKEVGYPVLEKVFTNLANDVVSKQLQTEANELVIDQKRTFWEKKKYTQEEKEVYTELVFRAKAEHNNQTLVFPSKPTTLPQFKAAFKDLFNQDKVAFVLFASAKNLKLKIPKKVHENYNDPTAIDTLLTGKNLSTMQTLYNEYSNELLSYNLLISERHNLFSLAKAIYNAEQGILNPIIEQTIQNNPHVVFSNNSILTTPSGKLSTFTSSSIKQPQTTPIPMSSLLTTSTVPSTPITTSTPSASALPTTPITTSTSTNVPIIPIIVPGPPGTTTPAQSSPTLSGSGLSSHEHVIHGNRYYINKRNLKNNILELRYVKNRHLVSIKPQMISNTFKDIVQEVLDGDDVDTKKFNKLNDSEQHLFRSITKYLNVNGGSLPDVSDNMDAKFDIIRGEILAGNTNPSLKRDLYRYLLHAYTIGKIKQIDFANMVRTYQL